MQSSEQKSGPPVEGSTFAEYPPTKSDNGIKSKESSSLDTGYTSSKIEQKPSNEGATFAEYKSTESIGLKSTIKPQNEDDKKDTAYTSAKIQQKESKEGSTFGEYPMTASVGIKSTTVNTSVTSTSVNPKPNLTASTGYNSMEGEYTSTTKIESKPSNEGATFAEYKSTESVGIKSTIQPQVENKQNLEASTGYNSMTGPYVSPNNNLQQKNSKEGATFGEYPMTASVGIKSTTVNTSVNPNPVLTTSTGYNSMEGEYTSTKIESKPSNEGATFAEYKSTESVGIKSTIQTQPNNNLQQKSSIEGSLFGECPMSVSVNGSQTQPTVINRLIIQVPSHAPILNTSLPTGNIQTSYIVTTTTTQQVLNPIPINSNIQPIQPIQPMQPIQPIQPIQTGQPLAGSTFATYPMTTSHGIKSSGVH